MRSLLSGLFLMAMRATAALGNNSNDKPNVVLILTDDEDILLGSSDRTAIPKTHNLLVDRGVTFQNMFATTPVCCPSRSSFHTGRYIHNLKVVNNSVSGNCAGVDWRLGPEKFNWATYMKSQGYHTMFSGKYLNNYGYPGAPGGLKHVPPGWDNWVALQGNSVYYNYSLSVNGAGEKHNDTYAVDYLTDVIANHSVGWLRNGFQKAVANQSVQPPNRRVDNDPQRRPFFLVASVPSCHEPADPAPQYAPELGGIEAPRTPGWNVHKEDRHWLVGEAALDGPMNQTMIDYSDLLYRRRLLTLKSVDDMVERLVKTVEAMGEADNTFFFYTSDHGYHLGQFTLALDKRQPYETDIRMPLFVRGPGIAEGSTIGIDQGFAANIDLAPTFLNIAGVHRSQIDPPMDGESLLPLLLSQSNSNSPEEEEAPSSESRRTDLLIEYHGEGDVNGSGCLVFNRTAYTGVECGARGPESTKTPPFYDADPWCSCQDASNNTYNCVRTVEPARQWQYCEWETGEREFYDVSGEGNWNVNNTLGEISDDQVKLLSERLAELTVCAGADECD